MSGTNEDNDQGQPPKKGFLVGLASLFVNPEPETAEGDNDVEPPTEATKPAGTVVAARPAQPVAVPSVQIDQERFDKWVSAITQNHPGLVVLTDALSEARELELDPVKTAKKITLALTKAGIGVIPLLDECTKAIQEVDAERQKFLNASASALDQEVGTSRRAAEKLGTDNTSLRAQIVKLQQQIKDNETQCTQLNAQADEAERAHKEREAVKLATVAAVTDHFNALKDMVQRSNGSH